MKPIRIEDLSEVEGFLSQYKRQGVLTNNYLLATDYHELIEDRNLYFSRGENNCYFLVEKPNCFRVYYLINDFSESFNCATERHLMLEILFRGDNSYPYEAEAYWLRNGLKTNLVRELYECSFKNINLLSPIYNSCKIQSANSVEDGIYAMDLFNSVFDPYSGDYVTLEKAYQFVEKRELLIATIENKKVGALNFYINGNKCWLGHVAVEENWRGREIGKNLVKEFILHNHVNDNTRYSLWVQAQNSKALEMYKMFGFKYANKSTLSMEK